MVYNVVHTIGMRRGKSDYTHAHDIHGKINVVTKGAWEEKKLGYGFECP